jgi:transcriptional regulator with XRE-family HTH domain
MLDIGSKIVLLRKQNGWSQTDFAKMINCSRAMLVNYEGNKNSPSIEVAIKMAEAFNVSLDYLIGKGKYTDFDNAVLKRIEDIEKLDSKTKENLFFLIDNVIQNYKTKQAFS